MPPKTLSSRMIRSAASSSENPLRMPHLLKDKRKAASIRLKLRESAADAAALMLLV